MKIEVHDLLMKILEDMVDSLGVEQTGTSNQSVDLIALLEQQFDQVRAVLTRDAGYERSLHCGPDQKLVVKAGPFNEPIVDGYTQIRLTLHSFLVNGKPFGASLIRRYPDLRGLPPFSGHIDIQTLELEEVEFTGSNVFPSSIQIQWAERYSSRPR